MEVYPIQDEEKWLEMRAFDITSTESPALLGFSPWITKYELWHRKKAREIVRMELNEQMILGKHVEPGVAAFFAEVYCLDIKPMKVYMRDPGLHMGSSFDFQITGREGLALEESEIFEIKNVHDFSFKEGWLVDENGNCEAPEHYEIQVQHQLAVSKKKKAWIGVNIGNRAHKFIERPRNEFLIDTICSEVARFWKDIAENREPTIDFERDAEFVKKKFNFAEPGSVLDARTNRRINELGMAYKAEQEKEKQHEAAKTRIKTELLTLIGTAEKVVCEGFTISAGLIGPSRREYEVPGYRTFRLNFPRKKKGESTENATEEAL